MASHSCVDNPLPPTPAAKTVIFSKDKLQQLEKDVELESSTTVLWHSWVPHFEITSSRLDAFLLPSNIAPGLSDVRFFQVVFSYPNDVTTVLKNSPLHLGPKMIFLMPFFLGFDHVLEK